MGYVLIVVVCLIVYYRSLKYGIVVDDIENRKKDRDLELKRSTLSQFRRALSGDYPIKSIFFDHCITLAVHTIVCLYIYEAFNFLPAALLFAVNTGNHAVSIWLNGKRYAISTILCLLTYIYAPIGIIFWLFTSMFQTNAITFPIILALRGYWYFIPFIPFLLFVHNKFLLKWIKAKLKRVKVDEFKKIRPLKVVYFLKTIFYYFKRGLFPFVPNIYPEKFKRFGLIDEETKEAYRFNIEAMAGLGIIFMAVVGYIYNPGVFFGLMWWLVTILVFGNLVTLTVPLADRYMYLPNIGLMLWVGMVLAYIHPLAWVLLFASHATRTWTFMPMYKNIETFLWHHCYMFPESDQCWNFKINKHSKVNDIFGVMFLSNEGLVNNPDSPLLWVHRAHGFNFIGKKDLARQAVEQAERYTRDGLVKHFKAKIEETKMVIDGKKGE